MSAQTRLWAYLRPERRSLRPWPNSVRQSIAVRTIASEPLRRDYFTELSYAELRALRSVWERYGRVETPEAVAEHDALDGVCDSMR